ncbi:hypothetical protein AB0442_23045 [Kitasatospora sp. NPDC085895]|uniref:hypothetical protein n=1 Tax=Kitasatospora sp. NPDC085895 TaxID=3155057 RepID=UPI00344DB059
MTDEHENALRAVAQNPEAFVAYLADLQRVLLGIGQNLETLQRETRVHLRSTHVEGDRWYHARLRALPLERQLADVLRHLKAVTAGLEKGAYKRRAHDDEVNALPGKRREKALEKGKKIPPALATTNSAESVTASAESRYGGPTTIFDLSEKRSA